MRNVQTIFLLLSQGPNSKLKENANVQSAETGLGIRRGDGSLVIYLMRIIEASGLWEWLSVLTVAHCHCTRYKVDMRLVGTSVSGRH